MNEEKEKEIMVCQHCGKNGDEVLIVGDTSASVYLACIIHKP